MSASLRRLKKRPEFLRVAAAQRKWVTPGMVVQAYRRQGPPQGTAAPGHDFVPAEPRVGLTVSRKVGKAVTRNRVRRRLRAVALDVLPETARADTDYVLIGRKGTLGRPYALLMKDLRWALSRLDRQSPDKADTGRGEGAHQRGARA